MRVQKEKLSRVSYKYIYVYMQRDGQTDQFTDPLFKKYIYKKKKKKKESTD